MDVYNYPLMFYMMSSRRPFVNCQHQKEIPSRTFKACWG